MRYIILICMIIMLGCALFRPIFIDSTLKYSVNRFKKDIGVFNDKKYTVKFKSLQSPIIGVCKPYIKTIEIDPTYWFKSSEKSRLALMYHEIGHCVCKLDHDNTIIPSYCGGSIMFPNIVSDRCLNKYWDYYLKELKLKCQGKLK